MKYARALVVSNITVGAPGAHCTPSTIVTWNGPVVGMSPGGGAAVAQYCVVPESFAITHCTSSGYITSFPPFAALNDTYVCCIPFIVTYGTRLSISRFSIFAVPPLSAISAAETESRYVNGCSVSVMQSPIPRCSAIQFLPFIVNAIVILLGYRPINASLHSIICSSIGVNPIASNPMNASFSSNISSSFTSFSPPLLASHSE